MARPPQPNAVPVTLDPGEVTATLNAEITPYFQWLSEGAYTPAFVAGGTVESTDVIDQQEFEQERAFAPECGNAVATASSSSPNGALIVVNDPRLSNSVVFTAFAISEAIDRPVRFVGRRDFGPLGAFDRRIGGLIDDTAADDVDDLLQLLLTELPVSHAAAIVSRYTGRGKNDVYRRALELQAG